MAYYRMLQKVSPKVACHFLSNRLEFNAKFHTVITCSYLHKQAQRYLILTYCCKVRLQNLILRDNIEILHIQKLSAMSYAYLKQTTENILLLMASE